jgi:hypothetical protein
MELAIALLGITLGVVGSFWLIGVWIGERLASRWAIPDHGWDPIRGPRDRIAIHDVGGPYIPMPDRLKAREEMVAWMMKELPKLTAEKASGQARGLPLPGQCLPRGRKDEPGDRDQGRADQ